MHNLLRAEQFKIKNNKSLKNILIGLLLFSIIFGALLLLNGISGLKIYYGMEPQAKFTPYLVASNSYLITISLCVFVGIYVAGEIDKGIIRNIISVGNSRKNYYFIKLLSQFFTCLIFVLLLTISFMLIFMTSMEWGKTVNLKYLIEIAKLLGLQFIIYSAYASIFVMVAFINRSIGGTMSICIVTVLAENIFAQMFSQIKIPVISTIIKYLPQTFLNQLGNSFPYNEPLSVSTNFSMILVSFLLIVVSTMIGVQHFKKKDI